MIVETSATPPSDVIVPAVPTSVVLLENLPQNEIIMPQIIMEPSPNKDPITPKGLDQEKQSSPPKSSEQMPEPATSKVEENAVAINQIEGHSITIKDHRGRDHILYNLPNLNSLPKCSSTLMSYLSAFQRKLRRRAENSTETAVDADEIQSRPRAAEKHIASVPIQLFNRFQLL